MSRFNISDVTDMLNRTCLTYLGHASVLIEMQGIRILTDPLLRTRLGLVFLHRCGPKIEPDSYQSIEEAVDDDNFSTYNIIKTGIIKWTRLPRARRYVNHIWLNFASHKATLGLQLVYLPANCYKVLSFCLSISYYQLKLRSTLNINSIIML